MLCNTGMAAAIIPEKEETLSVKEIGDILVRLSAEPSLPVSEGLV